MNAKQEVAQELRELSRHAPAVCSSTLNRLADKLDNPVKAPTTKPVKVDLILRGLTALLNMSTDMEWDDLTHRINLCFDVVNEEYHTLIREAQEKKQYSLARRLGKIVTMCKCLPRDWGESEICSQIEAIAKGE